MIINVLESGSNGNCTILTDKNKNQLVLDCGIKYEKIARNVDFTKVDGCFVSHEHSDHSLSANKMKLSGIDCFSIMDGNIADGKTLYLKNWYVVPIKVKHNVECYCFIVTSKVDKKSIAYITDTTYIPQINQIEKLDCLILETNWDEKIVAEIEGKIRQFDSEEHTEEENKNRPKFGNYGFRNHLSVQQVHDYFCRQNVKVKKLVMSHTSNSGLFDGEKATALLKPFANEIYVATKNLKIEI